MTNSIRCPFCGSEKVYYGSNIFRHCLRGLSGTRRRFCAGCQKKWADEAPAHWPNLIRGVIFVVIVLFFILLIRFFIAWSLAPDVRASTLGESGPYAADFQKKIKLSYWNRVKAGAILIF